MAAFFKHIIPLLFFFLYSLHFIAAQTIQFSTYTTEDGLSQGTILASLQDSKGYLWFGTTDGLNCFNGYEFTVYRNKPNDSNSLLDNEIMALLEDELGNIWIGTAIGLCRYTPSTQQFTHFQMMKYTHRKDLAQKAGKFMTALQERKELVVFKLCRLFKKELVVNFKNSISRTFIQC